MEGTAATAAEVGDARTRLPERQRVALDLRDRERRSYREIAAELEMSPGAVAQLIARARINLYDELRGTALASVAPSPDCERALPLIAMREDGQLEPSAGDAGWLDAHLGSCERCALAAEQMGEAEAAYRAWAPGIATAPARAATPPTRRRRVVLAAVPMGLLFLGGLAVVFAGADRSGTSGESAAGPATGRRAGEGARLTRLAGDGKADGGTKRSSAKRPTAGGGSTAGSSDGQQSSTAPVSTPSAPVVQGGGKDGATKATNPDSGTGRAAGKAAVEPTRQTSASKPSAKRKPAPIPASTSQPTAASVPPPTEPSPPAEEAIDEPGHRGEPPGKPADRPPR